jgi:hypothetical protein
MIPTQPAPHTAAAPDTHPPVRISQRQLEAAFAEPFPWYQDKKVWLLAIHAALGLMQANSALVVPETVFQALSIALGGQSLIDLRNAGGGEKLKALVTTAGRPLAMLIAAAVTLAATTLTACGPFALTRNGLTDVLDRLGAGAAGAFIARADIAVRVPPTQAGAAPTEFKLVCGAEETPPHTLTCEVAQAVRPREVQPEVTR